MKTCTRCGRAAPDSSARCECGGLLVEGDRPGIGEARVAGFWIRFAADLLDAIILGSFGFILATIFRSKLLAVGEKAALLGAPITLLYTGVLQSHLGRGQTLAKRLLGMRVVRLDGSYLSLDRSVVRWAIMGVVFYGTTLALAASAVVPALKAPVISAALAGTQVALILGCVLLVPFHPLKRGIHDLLTGSIVLRKGSFPSELVAKLNNPRRDRALAIGALAVAIAVASSAVFAVRPSSAVFTSAERVSAAMSKMGIQNPGIVDSTVKGPGATRHQIVATGYLPLHADGSPTVENADDRVLTLVRTEMPLAGVDAIVVSLRKGINLGVYSSYETTNRIEPAVPADAK